MNSRNISSSRLLRGGTRLLGGGRFIPGAPAFGRSLLAWVLATLVMLLSMPGTAAATALPDPAGEYPVYPLNLGRRGPKQAGLSLAGAKNEYLFLHFRISEPDLDSLTVKVTTKNRSKPLSFRFYQICSAPAEASSSYAPDALLPLEKGLVNTGKPLDILAVFQMPPDFPVGQHSYELLFASQKRTCKQPLLLRVFDFYLPDDLPITVFGCLWYGRYGIQNPEERQDLIKSYFASMREYKINALGGAYPLPLQEFTPATNVEDYQNFHQLMQYALVDLKYHFIQIPTLKGWRTVFQPDSDFVARSYNYFPAMQSYLVRNGWQEQALNYLLDEPKPEEHAAVYQAFSLAQSLAPSIKTLCTGWDPDPAFPEVIDIWATPLSYYKEAEAASAGSRGQEQWLYANRLHSINAPPAHQRLVGWLAYRHRVKGYMLWGLNFWPNDPWTTAPGDADYWRRGTFYYPHPADGSPVATFRLESLRRGFQDYLYFHELDKAYHDGRISDLSYHEIQEKVRALTENPYGQVNMEDLEDIRWSIGNLLDAAGRKKSPWSIFFKIRKLTL